MKKYVIATHGGLAAGIQSTLELFVDKSLDITYISAYTAGQEDLDMQIQRFFDTVQPNDQVVIFTDIYGGSVNQKFAEKSQQENVFVVAGFNVPLLLETMLSNEAITTEFLDMMIEKARFGMQQITLPAVKNNETDFFG